MQNKSSISKARNYRDLDVWNKAMKLANVVWVAVEPLSRNEWSLTDQLKRSSLSVPSNIAEGSARNSTKEFIRFLAIAKGSLVEMETQILFAQQRSLVGEKHVEAILQLSDDVGRMITRLQQSLESKLLT